MQNQPVRARLAGLTFHERKFHFTDPQQMNRAPASKMEMGEI